MNEIIYDTSIFIGYILADFVDFIDGIYSGIIVIALVLVIPMIIYTIYKLIEDSISYEGN